MTQMEEHHRKFFKLKFEQEIVTPISMPMRLMLIVKEEMTRIVEGMDKLEEQRRAMTEKHASESAPVATPVEKEFYAKEVQRLDQEMGKLVEQGDPGVQALYQN